jgi:DNA-binding transcriptional LysR family regulator
VPYRHRLAKYSQVLPQDLIGEPLLIPKTGTTRAKLNEWLDPIEHEMTVSMELDSTEMIKRFVMAEIGISFLAASHCAEEVQAKKLAAVSLGPEPMIRRLGLIYRKDKSLSKAALGFIQVTLENAGVAAAIGANQRFPKAAGS